MDEKSNTVPSKYTKVVRNNNWSKREKQVIIEQCNENPKPIHGTISSSVSAMAD